MYATCETSTFICNICHEVTPQRYHEVTPQVTPFVTPRAGFLNPYEVTPPRGVTF